MNHHVNGVSNCPLCDEKLTQAHPILIDLFVNHVKPKYPQCHISWSYRDKINQNEAYAMGRSKLPYPLSAHNKCDDQGNPCALALDLFELASNNMACWPWLFFKNISDDLMKLNPNFKWGGNWKTLGDADHFEIEIK